MMAARRDVEFINFRPNLLVKDIEASIAFYRDVIGFEVRNSTNDGSFALLGKGLAEVAGHLFDVGCADGDAHER